MTKPTSIKVEVTTDAAGNASVVSDLTALGRVLQMRYIPDGADPLDTGADLTVTLNESGVNVLTKVNIGTSAFTAVPRQQVHNAVDGSDALYADAGEPVLDFIYSAGERLKVDIASGGDTLSGVFEFLVG